MATRIAILRSIQEQLLPDLRQYRDFLRMVLPKTEEDKKLIKLFVDMLSEMITDIDSAEDLSDLKDWFNLTELVDNWDVIRNSFVSRYSSGVVNFISAISDDYVNGIDRGAGI